MSSYWPPGWLLWSDHRRGCSCSSKSHQVGTVRPHRQHRATCRISQPGDCEWAVHRWQKENRSNLHLPREELWTCEVKLSTFFSGLLCNGFVFRVLILCHPLELLEMRTEGFRYLSEVAMDDQGGAPRQVDICGQRTVFLRRATTGNTSYSFFEH